MLGPVRDVRDGRSVLVGVHPQLKLSPRIDGSWGDIEACQHVTGLESLRRAQERLLAKVQSSRSRP